MDEDTPIEVSRPGARFGIVSAEVMTDTTLSINARTLYALLATYAGQDRSGFPGRPRLMSMLGLSLSTVDRARRELIAAGVLHVYPRFGDDGEQRSSLYMLTDGMCGSRPPRVTSDTPPVSPMTTPPSHQWDPPRVMGDTHNRTPGNNTTENISDDSAGAPSSAAGPTASGPTLFDQAPLPVLAAVPDPEQPKGKTPKRATSLPDDFMPKPDHMRIAAERGVDLVAEFAKFTDYALANGRTYKDWDAALRNWVRNARPTPQGSTGDRWQDNRNRMFAVWEAKANAAAARQQQDPNRKALGS